MKATRLGDESDGNRPGGGWKSYCRKSQQDLSGLTPRVRLDALHFSLQHTFQANELQQLYYKKDRDNRLDPFGLAANFNPPEIVSQGGTTSWWGVK